MCGVIIHRALRAGSIVLLFTAATSAFAFQNPFQQDRVINGIVVLDDLSMSGRSYVDSYDSSAPEGYKSSKGKDAVVVTNGQMDLSGGSGVYGSAVSTRSGINLSGGSLVTGIVSYSTTYTASGHSTADARRQTLAQVNARSPEKCSGYPPAPTAADPWITGKFVYDASRGDLLVTGGNAVTLRGGTYCLNNIGLSGGSILTVTGMVVIRMNGSLDLSGGSVINKNGRPSSVQVSSAASGGGVSLTGQSRAFMTVFAPRWHVGLSGGSGLFGSLVGRSIAASGGSALHHDMSLGSYPIP